MRIQLATVLAGGILGVTGVVAAAPALAAVGADSAATVVDDRVTKIKAALAGLVSDKTLTQAQADKVAQTLADAKLGGPGGHMRHGPDLAAAAAALNMSQEELRAALHSGKSLAAIAKDQGVSVDTLVDKLVAAAKTRIAQAVKDGRLTQAEAKERLATLEERITEGVNRVRPPRPAGGFGDVQPAPAPSASSGATTSSYTPSA